MAHKENTEKNFMYDYLKPWLGEGLLIRYFFDALLI